MGRKQKDADEEEKLATMSQAGAAYSNYRPFAQQAMNAAMQQQLAGLQPMNDMLGMMGLPTQGGQGFGGIVTPEMMGVGQTSGAPGMVGPPQRSQPAPAVPQPPEPGARRKKKSQGSARKKRQLKGRRG